MSTLMIASSTGAGAFIGYNALANGDGAILGGFVGAAMVIAYGMVITGSRD